MADKPGMARSFSLDLDLLRLLAALAVMLAHAASTKTLAAPLLPNSVGHNAVVVFFLLQRQFVAGLTAGAVKG